MKKAFKSKVDFLLLPILLLLIAAEAYMIYTKAIIGIVAIAISIFFFIYMYLDTLYILTNDKLKVRSGIFFHREIYIKSIRKVKPVKHRKASPALSADRLEISYNRYGRIVVSPAHRSEFIKELKEVNPRIRIEERK